MWIRIRAQDWSRKINNHDVSKIIGSLVLAFLIAAADRPDPPVRGPRDGSPSPGTLRGLLQL